MIEPVNDGLHLHRLFVEFYIDDLQPAALAAERARVQVCRCQVTGSAGLLQHTHADGTADGNFSPQSESGSFGSAIWRVSELSSYTTIALKVD